MRYELDLDELPRRMRRRLAVEYLFRVHGLQVALASLATYAVRGGGPAYRKRNGIPYYTPRDLDSWARAKLGRRVTSNAELRP